jgi:ketosteroid isomerase-like protein
MVHDAENHTCMFLAKSTATTAIGPYANEYAVMLQFTEDGEKVVRFEEFVDSAYSMNFFQKLLTAAQAKKA